MDQTKYIAKTRDHEFVDSEMIMLLSRVYILCEDEGHAIMDCLFVFFHIKKCIIRHVEIYNVVGTLMDQPQE